MGKKTLYMADNLDDLKKRVDPLVTTKRLELLCRASNSLYQKIMEIKQKLPLDEEMMYVMVLRYLSLVEYIRTSENDDKFYKTRFGKLIDVVQELRTKCEQSLLARYNSEVTNTHEFDVLALKRKSPKRITDIFITPEALFDIMHEKPKQLLIIDARNSILFAETCIKHENVINVPEDIIAKGLTANALKAKLPEYYSKIYDSRQNYEHIVLMDLNTSKMSYPHTKLEDLRSILVEWDLENSPVNLPLVLEGGIKLWTDSYPTFVTNTGKVYSQLYSYFDEFMDDICYPDSVNLEDEALAAAMPEPVPETAVQFPVEKHQEVPSADITNAPQEPEPESSSDSSSPRAHNTPSSSTVSSDTSRDDFRIGTLIQNMITVAEGQIESEERLLALAEARLAIKEKILAEGRVEDVDYIQLRTLAMDVSKFDSHRIELNERRVIQNKRYERILTPDDEEILDDQIADLRTLDKKKLLKYQNRKVIEQKEEALKQNLLDLNFNSNWKPVLKVQSNRPEIPDRRTKPADQSIYAQLRDIKKTYSGHGLTGLSNIRNTCYLNSLIQCLRFCPQFLHEITLTNYLGTGDTNVTASLVNIIKTMWNEEQRGVVVRPSVLYNEVCKADGYIRGYANGSHEDIQEFFLFLIKTVHSEVSRPMYINRQEASQKLIDWFETFKHKISFVTRHFYHQIEITINCKSCGTSTVRYEYGNTFFINIPANNAEVNLCEQLHDFLKVTPEERKRLCAKCEKPVLFSKQITYYPTILPINIVRYSFSRKEGCILRKDNECVLQQEIYFGQCRYKLHSVSLHSGNRDVGHYTALCYHPFQKTWVEFNDEKCNFTNPNFPRFRVQCYMLFYTMQHNPMDVNKGFFL